MTLVHTHLKLTFGRRILADFKSGLVLLEAVIYGIYEEVTCNDRSKRPVYDASYGAHDSAWQCTGPVHCHAEPRHFCSRYVVCGSVSILQIYSIEIKLQLITGRSATLFTSTRPDSTPALLQGPSGPRPK